MKSNATTVDQYIAELPNDRREPIQTVRRVILDNLPQGYAETMRWGMISYEVPLQKHPDTYNGQPLAYAALASQKNYMSVYLMSIYANENTLKEFIAGYKESGKRMDMGKSCVRFKKIEDLPLPLIGQAVASVDVDSFIRAAERAKSKK